MEMSVSSEMTFFTTKQQSEICPHLRTGSSAEDRGRIDTSVYSTPTRSILELLLSLLKMNNIFGWLYQRL